MPSVSPVTAPTLPPPVPVPTSTSPPLLTLFYVLPLPLHHPPINPTQTTPSLPCTQQNLPPAPVPLNLYAPTTIETHTPPLVLILIIIRSLLNSLSHLLLPQRLKIRIRRSARRNRVAQRYAQSILFCFFDAPDLLDAGFGGSSCGGGGRVVAFGVPGEVAAFLPTADGCLYSVGICI